MGGWVVGLDCSRVIIKQHFDSRAGAGAWLSLAIKYVPVNIGLICKFHLTKTVGKEGGEFSWFFINRFYQY